MLHYLLALCIVSSATAPFVDDMQTFDMECLLQEDMFPCASGGCVTQSQFCNGIVDCQDGTDENFCPDHQPDEQLCNETHQYMCEDRNRCIPHEWICNGENDCGDGSDELNCTTVLKANASCKGFACGDGKCISSLRVCDGAYDCNDKSDETNQDLCRHTLLPHEVLDTRHCHLDTRLGLTNYKCLDGSYCLPRDRMCDGLEDCRDGSDEGDFCTQWHTMCEHHKCSANETICYPSRTGPQCACTSPGNLQYDVPTGKCVDVDECTLDRPFCSHSCLNYQGHFKCGCDEGYVRDSLAYLCYADGPEAMLFFTTRNDIKFLKIKTKQLVNVVSGVKQAHGVSFDGKYLYWVETAQGHQSIARAHLEDVENTKEVLLGFGLEEPGDISIDWLGRNLYSADPARGSIFVCRLDASSCASLKTNASHPKYITVDPKKGKMYWSDFIHRAVIMRANMDGSNPEVLVDGLRSFATGLTLDSPNDRLYFVDRTVKVVVLSTKSVYSLFEEPFHHPYSIAVFENTVFWSDWTSNTIQTTDKMHDNKENRHVLLTTKTSIYGMHMYHPAMHLSRWNPCSAHNCSHICVPTSNVTYSCLCPDAMELKDNVCHHIEGYHPQYLIVGSGKLFTRIEYNALGSLETHATHFDIGRVQAMAFDTLRDSLYIYDGQWRTISYLNMSDFTLGMVHEVISGLTNVVDMDYDVSSDSLYYMDAGRGVLEVLSIRTQRQALVYKFLETETPISFCVLSDYGNLLVTVMESDGTIHIDSMGLDGENRKHVFMNNLKGPHIRLRYSKLMDSVFVSNEGNGIIDVIHPEGTVRETFRELSTTVSTLAVTDNFVFWSDRRSPRLFWTDIHESTHRVRRIQLSIFPNKTQLLIQATAPHPDRSDPLLSHPCLSTNPCPSEVCVQSSPPRRLTHYFLGYKCLCPFGTVLKNGKCTKVFGCPENQMYCHRSDACVVWSKRCDGVKDCDFGEDEMDCEDRRITSGPCSEAEFRCGDDTCIGRTQVCDRRHDCVDGSDETETECLNKLCLDSEFMCASGSCIPKTWKCDGDQDCNDATDEIDCENIACKVGYFQCRNRECIEVRKRCDGHQDCFDYSDEDDCEDPVDAEPEFTMDVAPDCGDFEFSCELNKSICLPLTARCNKIIDCPGGTDEDGCEFRCAPHGRFACKQQLRCLSYNQLCNGRKDCDDGSDETPDSCAIVNKTSYLYPVSVMESECSDGFLCRTGQCLEWDQLCDGIPHCSDGSDEGGICSTACVNHTCPHICQATPQGPQCRCGAGWLSTGSGCQDIDECIVEPCAHTCHNLPGTFTCACHLGYALRSDRRSCKAVRGNMLVVYVSGNTVRSVSADGYDNTDYSDANLPTVTDLDVNVRKNLLYVTSAESQKLIEVNGTSVVTVTNVGHPTRVALDWITGNVYLIDSTPGSSCVRVCHIKRKRCARMQKLPSDAWVSSLVIDPKSSLMFYCVNRAFESTVWSSSLSGQNVQNLASVRNCTGLAVDSFTRRLYVAESGPARISRMDYNGGEHVNLLSDPHLIAPHSLALFEDNIYYLIANSLRLGRCRLFATRHCETFLYREFDANTFVIKHESVQRDDITNDCEGYKCDNVCVRDIMGPVCVCEHGELAANGDCPLVSKNQLALFNGWTYQQYLRAHSASFTVITTVMVALALYIALFFYYHFVYKPRKKTYTEVRYQTNGEAGATLSYSATVDMCADGSISHEFVNPLQYMKNILRHSTRKNNKPIGTAGLTIETVDLSQSPQADLSDTESDLDDKERLISRRY